MKKKVIILSIAAVVVIAGALVFIFAVWRPVIGEYKIPFYYSDGFTARLKVPEGTRYVRRAGLGCDEFKTKLSEEEVLSFYEDYFSGLKKVSLKKHPGNERHYDEEQRLVICEVKTIVEDNYTHFIIGYDTYNAEQWEIKETP